MGRAKSDKSTAANLAAAMMGAASRPATSTPTKPAKLAKLAKPAKPGTGTTARPPPAEVRAPSSELGSEAGTAVGAAIEAGDGATALTVALAWWRRARAPEVADLIDAISERVSPPASTDSAAWSKAASAKDPVALGGLLAVVPELPASFLPTAATLLAAYPPDPRITAGLARWVAEPPTTSTSNYPFWTKIFAVAVAIGDRRAIAAFDKRRARAPGATSMFWPKFYGALDKTAATIAAAEPAPTPLDGKTTAAIAKLARAAATLAPATIAAGGNSPTANVSTELADAVAALARGDVLAAIDTMVAHWRTSRAPELADLAERASTLLPSYDRVLPLDHKAMPAAWAALLEDPRANLPQLLDNLDAGGAKLAEPRLVDLANLPDDPRTSLALAERCAMASISPERTQYWRSLLELIARIADARTARPLRVIFRDFTNKYYDHHKQAKRIIAPFVLGAHPPTVLDEADRAHVAKLDAAIGKAMAADRHRALVAAIAAAPADPAPRLVYADWLSDRDHPRGERLVLAEKYRTKTATAAELDRLFELYDDTNLLGALDDFGHVPFYPSRERDEALAILAARFPHGLVDSFHVLQEATTLTWRRVALHPLAALVRELDLEYFMYEPDPAAVAAVVAAAPNLRRIGYGNVEDAYVLAIQPVLLAAGFSRAGKTFTRSV